MHFERQPRWPPLRRLTWTSCATLALAVTVASHGAAEPGRWASIGPARVTAPPLSTLGSYNAVGRITAIAVHPTNSRIIYVGSAGQLGHEGCGVWKTTDGGQTWTPISDQLPTLSIGAIAIDPTNSKTIWVGTEIGVYRTTDGGATWAPYGIGLPLVRVTDIQISTNASAVRVSTYGRGVWEIYPNSESAVANGNGDFDRNKVIDFFDVASFAARMGSTPSATNNLVYDSLIDLNGSASLDETNLGLLLAKFGSTP